MQRRTLTALSAALVYSYAAVAQGAVPVPLFDGRTLAGWEGNQEMFRVADGAIVGGSLEMRIPRNEFLCTTREYGDFELRAKFKVLGKGANAGIQFRSQRVPEPPRSLGLSGRSGGWLVGLTL